MKLARVFFFFLRFERRSFVNPFTLSSFPLSPSPPLLFFFCTALYPREGRAFSFSFRFSYQGTLDLSVRLLLNRKRWARSSLRDSPRGRTTTTTTNACESSLFSLPPASPCFALPLSDPLFVADDNLISDSHGLGTKWMRKSAQRKKQARNAKSILLIEKNSPCSPSSSPKAEKKNSSIPLPLSLSPFLSPLLFFTSGRWLLVFSIGFCFRIWILA